MKEKKHNNPCVINEFGGKGLNKKIPYPIGFIDKIIKYIKLKYPQALDVKVKKDFWQNEYLEIEIDEDDGQPTHIVQHPLEWEIVLDITENFLPRNGGGFNIKVVNLNTDTKLRGHKGENINESIKNIKKERDDIERAVQDLNRFHNFNVSYDDMAREIAKTSPQPLSTDIWDKLENTESNSIQRGDYNKVFDLANKYNKSNPLKLKNKLESGDYKCPIIVRFEDRYHLVAGNTRLCTAAAMGMTPQVIIADINKPYPVEESLIKTILKTYHNENI